MVIAFQPLLALDLFTVGKALKKYGWNVLIAIDQLANAILLGDPDETISSRAAKHYSHKDGWGWLARTLDKIDPGHSKDSIELDEGKDAIFP